MGECFTEASDADKKGANWNVETLKKTKSGDVQLEAVAFLKSHWQIK